MAFKKPVLGVARIIEVIRICYEYKNGDYTHGKS